MTSAALQLPNNNPRDYEGLPEELRQEYAKILNLYSTDDFYSAIWHIHLNKAKRTGNIRFPQSQTLLESDITRITVIITLTSGTAIATCQRRVHDFNTILNFFASENLNLHYITQNGIDNFIKYLDSSPYDAWKRNQYMQSLQVLTESLTTFDVIHIPSNLNATYRFPQQCEPKRAPDTITINQLDSFFFDNKVDIPLDYRAIYLLLRLHTHRFSEVAATPLDCISYPDDNVFAITIPNSKETPLHMPNYQKYNFLLTGFCGGFCHDIVYKQQQYATDMQQNIPDEIKDYLFVSHKGPHLVTTSEFNSFLSEFCAQHQIVDAAGNPAKITSHDLRHIDVCERFKSNIVSTERTSVECNHACVEDTMGYGYYSKHDEATHLAEIVKPILPFDFDTAPSPRKVPPRKYETLAKQPATRVIPYYGLCLNRKCSPQFEKCFHCGSFIPDPQYKKYIKANIERLQKVNDQILKKHGNPTVLQQNLKDIQTFNIYLEKMDVTEEHQKRSRVV